MTEQATPKRVFKYIAPDGPHTWGDPGPDFDLEDVKRSLAGYYPEIATATTRERTLEDGTVEIEFVKKAGTKGSLDPANEAKQLLGYYLEQAFVRAGLGWTTDNQAEVDQIVDLIVEAATEQRQPAPAPASRSGLTTNPLHRRPTHGRTTGRP